MDRNEFEQLQARILTEPLRIRCSHDDKILELAITQQMIADGTLTEAGFRAIGQIAILADRHPAGTVSAEELAEFRPTDAEPVEDTITGLLDQELIVAKGDRYRVHPDVLTVLDQQEATRGA